MAQGAPGRPTGRPRPPEGHDAGVRAGREDPRAGGLLPPEEITEDVFDVPIALGTIANVRAEVSDALAPAHAEALHVVRGAAVKNVDETSWKLAGKRCWLWVA